MKPPGAHFFLSFLLGGSSSLSSRVATKRIPVALCRPRSLSYLLPPAQNSAGPNLRGAKKGISDHSKHVGRLWRMIRSARSSTSRAIGLRAERQRRRAALLRPPSAQQLLGPAREGRRTKGTEPQRLGEPT